MRSPFVFHRDGDPRFAALETLKRRNYMRVCRTPKLGHVIGVAWLKL